MFGMLREVVRPDRKPVRFRYDALGRRTTKFFFGEVTRWVWDGNVPLHEWKYSIRNQETPDEKSAKPIGDKITWVFEEGTFIPTAKIQGDKQYSIVSDYLGTPIQMYDEQGNKTWDCSLDIYGKVLIFDGRSLNDCPFRFQGQYEDEETGLYYNRFRYYDSSTGTYLSQDPIGLAGNNPTLYGYVCDPNNWLDIFGLDCNKSKKVKIGEEIAPNTTVKRIGFPNISGGYEIRNKFFKGCISPKDITHIQQQKKQDTCYMFEGFMDYLSFLTLRMKKSPGYPDLDRQDYIILNSVSNLSKALCPLGNYEKIHCFFDNDKAGIEAVQTLYREYGLRVRDVSRIYGRYNDLNDYLCGKLPEQSVQQKQQVQQGDVVQLEKRSKGFKI